MQKIASLPISYTTICHKPLSQQLQKISDDFTQTYKRYRKISEDVPMTLENFESIYKATILTCCDTVQLKAPFWNIYRETQLNFCH